MLYIVLAYLMLFAALTNSVCLNNASFFFLFKYFLCQGYELSGEIALKNNHYYYYYYLSGKIKKTLQWDSLQHRRAVADLCMFHKLRNNLANIAIPPILVPSVKHNCHYNHIQSLHSDAFRYKFFARGVRLWSIIPYHLTTKPSLESFRTATFKWISPLQWCKHPGTNTWCLVQNSV